MLATRLGYGYSIWPQASNGPVSLTQAQVAMLVWRNRLAASGTNLETKIGLVNATSVRANSAYAKASRP
jgi:hypothetical protein